MSKEDQQKDRESRWYRATWGGKSYLQRSMEKELQERRAMAPLKTKRKPLKWYWWLAIAVGFVLWTALAFWLDGRV